MAVLIEAISVVVRRDAVVRSFRGGWEAFRVIIPNNTFCADAEISRIGFMEPNAARNFIERLEFGGLTFVEDGEAKDLAVVDQQRGPTVDCRWLEFSRFSMGNSGYALACWMWDKPRKGYGVHTSGKRIDLHTPPGWRYEGSLSQNFTFVPSEERNERLKFLRREGNLDVFQDNQTGEILFLPRDEPNQRLQ